MLENKKDYTIKTVRTVNDLLDYSVLEGAEYILIEKEEGEFSVKLGFNGELKESFVLSEKTGVEVVGKIKEMASLVSSGKRIMQSGKFKKMYLGFKVIFSILVKPEKNGERLAIEILNEKPELLYLKKLGFTKNIFTKIEQSLKKEKGGILVVGGFNSGKTTTLYSLLDFVNKPELNVVTIERDIFYDMPSINQSLLDLRKGFDYSFALPSLLRQDPDIIMIDEINEENSVRSFLDIAQRGHLILAGVYSKNFLTCLDFFNSLGVGLSLFASTVNMIINQELVKKNCVHCLVKEELNQKIKKEIEAKIDVKDLLKRAKAKNIISKKINSLDDVYFYKSKGCQRCKNKNTINHVGVFEVLEITDNVKKIIKDGHISRIRDEVKNQEGVFMEEDALLKATNGIISIDQVLEIIKR